MATIPARRKGACFLRIRENCPFRKLRKNRRYDVTTASSAGAGVRWSEFSEHPISTNDGPMSHANAESLPPVPSYQLLCHHHQSQGPVAMDLEEVRAPSPTMALLSARPPGHAPDLQPPPTHHHRCASGPPTDMEMDSGVDPETGERAQR